MDTDNVIRIYSIENMKYFQSYIDAEYIIESQLQRTGARVYIFLKQREEALTTYCVASFFKKGRVVYGGEALYWMLKEKKDLNGCITLYRHPDYNNVSL